MFTLIEGQIIKLNVELEFWQEDGSRVDRSDRWDSARIVDVYPGTMTTDDGVQYVNVDLEMVSGYATGWVGNFDIEETMIEP